jgi:hypothetical protein
MVTFLNKESLTTKLTLIIIGLTAGSGLLIPATYASLHPVTSGEIADGTIRSIDISNTDGVRSSDIVNGQVGSVDIANGQVTTEDIGTGQVRTGDILDGTIRAVDVANPAFMKRITLQDGAPGWNPNGAATVFGIPDNDANDDNSIIIVNTDSANSPICGVDYADPDPDKFGVRCDLAPANGAELHYAIIQIQNTAIIGP